MTVVSSKEFVKNEDKYFDLALNEALIVQRGDHVFFVQNSVQNIEPDEVFEPDDEFYKSITAEEFLEGIHASIDKFFDAK